MKTPHPRVPRDIRSYHEYARLLALLKDDRMATDYIFWHFWTNLAYQVESTGIAGLFKREAVEAFETSLMVMLKDRMPDGLGAVELLLRSRFLLVKKPDDYFCPLFSDLNNDMDADWVTGQMAAVYTNKFASIKESAVKVAPGIAAMVGGRAWDSGDGATPVTVDVMESAIVLIMMVDHLLGHDERAEDAFSDGVVQPAVRVVQTWPPARLNAVMRRWFRRMKTGTKRDIWQFSGETDACLSRFNDIAYALMPDDGWERTYESATP